MAGYDTVDDAPDRKMDRQQLGRLLGFVKPYRKWVITSVICSLLVAGVSVSRADLTRIAINDFIEPGKAEGLLMLCAVFCGVIVIQGVLQYGLMFAMAHIGQSIIYDLRTKLFRHTIRMDAKHYDRTPVGEMVSRVTSDVDALNEMFSSGFIMIISDVLLLLFITIRMFWANWEMAAIAFLVLPFLLIASFFFRVKARQAFRSVRKSIGELNGFMQERVGGMAIVQLFTRERRDEEQFNGINGLLRGAHVKTVLYYATYFPVVELLSTITISLIIWYGGGQVVQDSVSIGELFMFVQLTEMFFHPVYDLSDKYNLLQNAMAASERIFRLLDNKGSISSGGELVTKVDGHIEFDKVNFAYNSNEPIIRDLSLDIKPGETVAIVGATGAGKTTIISLLSRFYDIEEGTIKIDGKDIRSLDLDSMRRHISVVLQDVFLFPGTIRDNIRLETDGITEDDVLRAAIMVGVDEFIKRLPAGYETELNEDGGSLSVGQKQLLSFARAIAHDPRILVLDEATSNVDTETEHLIQKAIVNMMEERTAIVIAHRLSTIRHADRIAVMHHGVLRELGTHQELLAKRGIYHRLYQLQYKDQELA